MKNLLKMLYIVLVGMVVFTGALMIVKGVQQGPRAARAGLCAESGFFEEKERAL